MPLRNNQLLTERRATLLVAARHATVVRPLTMTSLIQRIPSRALVALLYAILIAFAVVAYNNPG